MGGSQATIALIVGVVITLFVPALVWATVLAGLYQIARERIKKASLARAERRQSVSVEARSTS